MSEALLSVIERGPLTNGLRDFLKDNVGWETGVLQVPMNKSTGNAYPVPYLVLIPRSKGQFKGPMGDPWSDADFAYQIKSVGKTEEQAQWGSDAVRRVLLQRFDGGGYAIPFEVEGLTITERRPDDNSPGTSDKQGNIFEVDDFYIISVTTS